jgi:hypothetical protein
LYLLVFSPLGWRSQRFSLSKEFPANVRLVHAGILA